MKRYSEYVQPYVDKFKQVKVPVDKVDKIKKFADNVVERKKNEDHHKDDSEKEYKRFYTGTLGEAAIEEFLGIEIIDWSIGDSKNYTGADLRRLGINIGVKTVEYGKFHVIHKRPVRPEIITFKTKDDEVLVCGIASVGVLKRYQDDDLILSKKLRERGVKTGFYGYRELKPFANLNDLKKLVGKWAIL